MSTDIVNVCIMSRNRAKRLITAIDYIKKNSTGVDYKMSLLFDDDKESFDLLKSMGYDCYLYTPQQECVKMTNNCFKLTKQLGLNYFVFLNDDMEVQTNWLSQALSDFEAVYPDKKGLISFNTYVPTEKQGGNTICVAGLTTVSFIDECLKGIFFDEIFTHNEGDGEFTYRVMFLKKYKWSKESRVCHNHYIQTPVLMDETYSQSSRFFSADLEKRKKLFANRGWTDQVLKDLLIKTLTIQ